MAEIWTMGELLVEIMRPDTDMALDKVGSFLGPYPSGAPGIFIDTVARLGHSGAIIGGVGKDDFGKCILARLEKDGVDCRYILESKQNSTGVAFVTYFSDGSRKFIYHIGNTAATEVKTLDASLQGCDYFHIMGCSLMASDSFAREILATMDAFVQKGAKVSFDPNIRPELLRGEAITGMIQRVMENCQVFLPGEDELLKIAGEITTQDAVKRLFQNPRLEVIALKRGSRGSTIYTPTESFDVSVYKIEVKDPTGAGDSFDAAFLCGLLEGKPLLEATKMATAAAALNTAAFGPMEGRISPEHVAEIMIQSASN